MKKTVALVALACLLCLGGSALATIGTADVVPAATLLIPRFEVDLGGGVDTLFSINNASAETVLAHVTFWTEWWVPILDFDVYLTGYDVQSISVRDIIVNGNLPQIGSVNTLSNRGLYSGPHVNIESCSNTSGPTNYAALTGAQTTLLQQAFSGQPITALGNSCAAQPGNETLARGYVTVDSVSRCSTEFPSDAGYFQAGGTGTANNNNVLWGDYFIVDAANNFAQGFTAVHVEASLQTLPCDDTFGFPYTFYCSLTAAPAIGQPGIDQREALGSVYATRYLDGGAFDGGTSIIAWRDPKTGAQSPRANCTNTPSGQNQIVVFDEEENPFVVEQSEPSLPGEEQPIFPFPWCTNRAAMGEDIGTESDFGWVYLNLNTGTNLTGGAPGGADSFNQAYVTVVMDASGRFSVGFDGLQLNNLTSGDTRSNDPLLNTLDLPTLISPNPLFVQ